MIQKLRAVDGALRAELDRLIQESAAIDGFETEIYTDASLNARKEMPCAFAARQGGELAGFLFVFAPTVAEVEISALVHPSSRGRGLFTALLTEALEECEKAGYSRGFLVCNRTSGGGARAAESMGGELDHTEYQMEFALAGFSAQTDASLSLARTTAADIATVAPLMAECFGMDPAREETYLRNSISSTDRINWRLLRGGVVVGFCGTYREDGADNVFGLGVLPAERRKGYARAMLDLLARRAQVDGLKSLRLDVDSLNANALSLYRAYGFSERSATDYYELSF